MKYIKCKSRVKANIFFLITQPFISTKKSSFLVASLSRDKKRIDYSNYEITANFLKLLIKTSRKRSL